MSHEIENCRSLSVSFLILIFGYIQILKKGCFFLLYFIGGNCLENVQGLSKSLGQIYPIPSAVCPKGIGNPFKNMYNLLKSCNLYLR
jgi:hypothetical protein